MGLAPQDELVVGVAMRGEELVVGGGPQEACHLLGVEMGFGEMVGRFKPVFKYWNLRSTASKCTQLTCDPVSRSTSFLPLEAFQRRMCLSAEPPPVASRLGCQGHHARAWE